MKALRKYIDNISPIEETTFARLLKCFKSTELKKNDFFVRAGEHAQEIGFLTQGIVRAFFLNQEGKEYTKQFFVGPSIIGAYTSLISKQPNKIVQQALTDCEVLVADFKEIEQLYAQFHDLERLGRRIAEQYFMEKEQKELEMALLDADQRYLLMRKKFPSLEAHVPQYQVAAYLGITPTQLSRIRKKLTLP
ncbi:MAG: Crp/Fnr family transcriptional regulator [Bacteroidota bacterium]